MEPTSRPKKTDIVRKRTGCQRCRAKRRKCDETRPECLACVQRGLPCGGYQRRITFKDVSLRTAESSRKTEEAKWSALRRQGVETEQRDRTRASEYSSPREETLVEVSDENLTDLFGGDLDAEREPPSPSNYRRLSMFDHSLSFLTGQAINRLGHEPELVPPLASFRPTRDISIDGPPEKPPSTRGGALSLDLHSQLFPPPQSGVQNALMPWTETTEAATAWDDLLNLSESSRSHSPTNWLPAALPSQKDICIIPSEDALLRHFHETVVHTVPLDLPFSELLGSSTGFRAAVLALSASSFYLTQVSPTEGRASILGTQPECHYYDFAVKDLAHRLKAPPKESGESLLGTIILLIYRDLAVGSHSDMRNHLRKLEAVASTTDLASYATPALLRAWRMLLYDFRMQTMPTRKSVLALDSPQPCVFWDSQMEIRDILTTVWKLQCRHAIEASFTSTDTNGPSASRRAVQWLFSMIGRQCDYQQLLNKDYHEDDLSGDKVLEQCDIIEQRLDSWHSALPQQDLPTPSLGSRDDIIVGTSFGTIVVHRLADTRKALDYIMFLISRMTCQHLRSRFQANSPASVSDAWAWIVLGIAAGTGIGHPSIMGPNVMTLLYMTALICEGTAIATAILEGIIPRSKTQTSNHLGRAQAVYLQRVLELIVRERLRGRAIRFMLDSLDEYHKMERYSSERSIVGFGDYNGRGYFRDIYPLNLKA